MTSPKKSIFLILAMALVVRLVSVWPQKVIFTDSAYYLSLAENIFRGEGYRDIYGNFSYSPPLYPILTGLIRFICPDTEIAARIVSIIFGVLSIYLIYILAAGIWNKSVGIMAIAIATFHPYLVEVSTFALTDALHVFLLLSGFYLTWRIIQGKGLIFYLWAGIVFGLGYLTRVETVLYLLASVIAISILREKKKPYFLILMLIVFVLIIAPYLWTIKVYTGHWSTGGKTVLIDYMFKEIAEGESLGEWWRDIIFKYLRNLNKIYFLDGPMFFPPFLVFFSAFGLAGYGLDKSKVRNLTMIAIMLMPLLFHPLNWIIPRYFLIFIAMGLIWAGGGIVYLAEMWTNFLKSTRLKWLNRKWLEGFLISILILTFLPKLTQPFREDKYYRHFIEHKAMGLWMKENIPGKKRIISRKPYVAFYAEGEAVGLPDIPSGELYNFAVENKVNYVVIDERSLRRWKYTELGDFLTKDAVAGFKLVREMNPKSGYRIRLWAIREEKK